MKKRNILTIALALVLTAVLSVGATLAYLTSTDQEVVNTFTFADGMTVKLWEPEPQKVADETITGDAEHGWNYTDVVVGQKLNKEPKLSTITSVDAYVFVKISGFNANMMTTTVNTDWTGVEGKTETVGNGIYYKEVNGATGEQQLGSLFTEVEINSTATDLNDIKIQVYEIQKNGITFADALAEAEKEFNKTVTPTPGA